jgi:hypothetical protein
MTLSISISADAEAQLRRRAAAEGVDPADFLSRLVERSLNPKELKELLSPLHEEFAAGGTTDDELLAQIQDARDAYRREQRR